jgi:hypothetical protein
VAHALGGEVSGQQVLAPGPRHGPRDRSLSVSLSASSPDGFVTFSFAGDDFRACRDHVKAALGMAASRPSIEPTRWSPPLAQPARANIADWRAKATTRARDLRPICETSTRRAGFWGLTPQHFGSGRLAKRALPDRIEIWRGVEQLARALSNWWPSPNRDDIGEHRGIMDGEIAISILKRSGIVRGMLSIPIPAYLIPARRRIEPVQRSPLVWMPRLRVASALRPAAPQRKTLTGW